jgi:hypothetical protein
LVKQNASIDTPRNHGRWWGFGEVGARAGARTGWYFLVEQATEKQQPVDAIIAVRDPG